MLSTLPQNVLCVITVTSLKNDSAIHCLGTTLFLLVDYLPYSCDFAKCIISLNSYKSEILSPLFGK